MSDTGCYGLNIITGNEVIKHEISLDEEVAQRLHEEEQAKFNEEQEMLARAERAEEEEGHSSAQVEE
ncbi:hypothetical protein Tco_0027372 [Tanacetum coccineum]